MNIFFIFINAVISTVDLFNFISGLVLLTVFGWIFPRNIKRKGFLHAYLRLETLTGIISGLYLIITAFY